ILTGANFQSKTLIVKNKNKIFPKFLSPSINTTYEQHANKNSRIFGSKLHTRLIIEGGFFSPAPTLRMRCILLGGVWELRE
ncbi:MAG: hypothetical protein ACYSU4_10335, partial [Planctomycetota bacterium]